MLIKYSCSEDFIFQYMKLNEIEQQRSSKGVSQAVEECKCGKCESSLTEKECRWCCGEAALHYLNNYIRGGSRIFAILAGDLCNKWFLA